MNWITALLAASTVVFCPRSIAQCPAEFLQRVTPPIPAAGASLGTDVSISGDWLAMANTGSTLIYKREGASWQHRQTLTGMGNRIDFAGHELFVGGAPPGTPTGPGGSITVLTLGAGDQWQVSQVLQPPNAISPIAFGSDIDSDGDWCVVGASLDPLVYGLAPTIQPGSAFVYRKTLAGWAFYAKLVGSPMTAYAHFGHAVAVESGLIVVGAPDLDGFSVGLGGGQRSGATFVFDQVGGQWSQTGVLTSGLNSSLQRVGSSVVVAAERVYAGGPGDLGNNVPGAVHAWEKNTSGVWLRTATLSPAPVAGQTHLQFGESLAASRDAILVGSPRLSTPQGERSGFVCVFEKDAIGWYERDRFGNETLQWNSGFAQAMAASEGLAIAGAPGEDVFGIENTGAAYLYQFDRASTCPADLTKSAIPGSRGYGRPDCQVTNDDYFYYLGEFSAGNLAVADLTASAVPGSPGYGVPNGVIDNDDFFYYLTIFAAGC